MAEVLVLDQARGQKIFYIILQLQDPNENWIGQPTVNLDALLYCDSTFTKKAKGDGSPGKRHYDILSIYAFIDLSRLFVLSTL